MNAQLIIAATDFEVDFETHEAYEPHKCLEYSELVQGELSLGVHLQSSDQYVRVYKLADIVGRNIPAEYPEANQLITSRWSTEILDFLVNHSYSFLPKVVFKTEYYIAFEWYREYEPAAISDFMEPKTVLSDMLNVPVDVIHPTPFFNNTLSQLKTLYVDQTIQDTIPIDLSSLPGFEKPAISGPGADYLTITLDQIHGSDFIVTRDSEGAITDWKYARIGSIETGIPRYMFVLDEDTSPREDENTISENFSSEEAAAVWIYVYGQWYRHCSVASV